MDKNTEQVKVWLDEALLLALSKLADRDDRKLSEYIRVVLSHHVYGHASRTDELIAGAKSPDSVRN